MATEFTMKQIQQEQVLADMLAERCALILSLSQELAQAKRQIDSLRSQLAAALNVQEG